MESKEIPQRQEVPHAPTFHVRIDGDNFRVETEHPTGEFLLTLVGKRPCAFELLAQFAPHRQEIIQPGDEVDLRQPGLTGFITVHKDVPTIFINDNPYPIRTGDHTVAEILGKVGQTSDGYVLLQEKDGPPLPVQPDTPVKISGCEVFHTQPQSGGSS